MKAGARIIAILGLCSAIARLSFGQAGGGVSELISAQRDAQNAFAALDGVWRGPAWTILPSGEKRDAIQTERVGLMLVGSLRVIEGRSFVADGTLVFDDLSIISFAPETKTYWLRSYALGRWGDFPLKVISNGFIWEIPLGRVTLRYTATVKDGVWHEIGESIATGKEPVRFLEMNLRRIADTDWPSQGAVLPK